jgi:hypothetical protein
MFTDLSLQVTLGSEPSSLTSHYRWPLWVRHSGQLQSLPISLYRSLLIRKIEKNNFKQIIHAEDFSKLDGSHTQYTGYN